MEIVVQVAGRALPGKLDEMNTAFKGLKSDLLRVPAFLRAEAMVNHNSLQVQMFFRFSAVDPALAFIKGDGLTKALDPFKDMLHQANTLVVSVVEGVIDAAEEQAKA